MSIQDSRILEGKRRCLDGEQVRQKRGGGNKSGEADSVFGLDSVPFLSNADCFTIVCESRAEGCYFTVPHKQ